MWTHSGGPVAKAALELTGQSRVAKLVTLLPPLPKNWSDFQRFSKFDTKLSFRKILFLGKKLNLVILIKLVKTLFQLS